MRFNHRSRRALLMCMLGPSLSALPFGSTTCLDTLVERLGFGDVNVGPGC